MSRLSYNKKYIGVFKNSKGDTKSAYILWDNTKSGFFLRDVTTDKILVNTAFQNLREMRNANVNFILTGNTEEATKQESKESVAA